MSRGATEHPAREAGRTPFFSAWLEQWEELRPALPIYRVIVALYVLLAIVPRHLWVAEAPEALLAPPPGLPMLLPSPPGEWALLLANGVLFVSALLLLLAVRPRWSALGIATSLMVLNSWAYAFGKINHGLHLLVAACLILAFSSWGGGMREEGRRDNGGGPVGAPSAWPAGLFAAVVALAMLTAAVPKALTNWLSLDASGTQYHFLRNHLVAEREAPLTDVFVGMDSLWFWNLLDYATIGLEAAFLVALISPRAFRVVCAMAVFFHLGVWLKMDITFTGNLVAYAAFVRWDRLGEGLRGWLPDAVMPSRTLTGVPALLLWLAPWGLLAFVLALGALDATGHADVLSGLQGLLAPWVTPTLYVIASLIAGGYLAGEAVRAIRRAPAWWASRTHDSGTVLFDGHCTLCNRWVDFLIRRDQGARIRFGSLQSPAGQKLLAAHGEQGAVPEGEPPSSMVWVSTRGVLRESDAALMSLATLRGPWRGLALVAFLCPRWLRDETYRCVAKHRRSLFGHRETCRVPSAEEKERFI